jgi:tetratricopeptide (TPR) repeat protein
MKHCAIVVVFALALVLPVFADEGHHHDKLTPEQLGNVHFPVSCAPEVQKPFERGIALLHSFWYEESQKEFEDISRRDPQCAMAHWGVAMSRWHQLWDTPDAKILKPGSEELAKAMDLKPKTDRERDYIAALATFYAGTDKQDHHERTVAYSQAMEKMYQRYPDDREAATFYALSLIVSEPDHDTSFANRKRAVEILDKLMAVEPNHPGVAHYLIHACDKPQLASLGLNAARSYAKIAPDSPHALHMPSHIFARLGLWQDDIDSNLASIAATRKTAAMHMGGGSHQYHAMDFLVYAYLQSGREADALRVVEEVKNTSPSKEMDTYGDMDVRLYALSAFPANYAIELRHWSEAAALQPVPNASPGDRAFTYWARAIGAARSGNLKQAREDVEQLEAIHKTLVAERKNYMADAVDQGRQSALAWISHAEGKDDDAIKTLRLLAEKEEATGEEPEGIPAREMLADMLLDSKHPEQALVEYEADLKFNPNRFNGLYGAARAAEAAGRIAKANVYYAQLVKMCEGSHSDRPELAKAKELLARK